jgi:hypothetical protein
MDGTTPTIQPYNGSRKTLPLTNGSAGMMRSSGGSLSLNENALTNFNARTNDGKWCKITSKNSKIEKITV